MLYFYQGLTTKFSDVKTKIHERKVIGGVTDNTGFPIRIDGLVYNTINTYQICFWYK